MSATANVRSTASRAANSKPLEYLARGGFIAYGVIHLLFAWLAVQVAFFGSDQETDQSGALRSIAAQPGGKFALVLIIVGMAALALWQAFEAAIGESGPRDRTAMAERVISGCRAVLYAYFAYLAYKVVTGASASQGDSQQSNASNLMDSGGGRFLVGLIGLVVLGVGIGLIVYGLTKKFEKHLETYRMTPQVRQTVRRLGVAGYTSKGVAYGIAGVLVIAAAVTYDPEKARGLDAALKALSDHAYGVWLLALIGLGIACFGVYCFAQAKYRKV
jgi:Ca2+/Na+ antiporter